MSEPRSEKGLPRTVLFRPRWSRQWVTGHVLARRGKRLLLRFGVDTDLFGSYDKAQWRHVRHTTAGAQSGSRDGSDD